MSDFLSSGERTGKSLNPYSGIACWRCCVGVEGPAGMGSRPSEKLPKLDLAEGSGKAHHRW